MPELKAPPVLPVYYMEICEATYDARLGKLAKGMIVPMDEAKASRFLTVGAAVQASEGAYKDQQGRKAEKAQGRAAAFQALNDGHAAWDVSTYRDVLTAPEGGLRLARERGIPLVNVHMLRDEDGDPLPPDADIEDILDARQLLHADLTAPFAAHDRSSVMGGGSPYASNMSSSGVPMPLSPQHRAMMERVAEQEQLAQRPASFSYDRENPGAKQANQNAERANRAERRAAAKAPASPVSPQAPKAAEDAGVTKPASGDLKPEQKA
jgi:hypothetical protein